MRASHKRWMKLFSAVLSVATMAVFLPNAQAAVFSQTRIIVTDCVVEGGGLVAGNTSEVTVTLKNTSAQWPVQSVLVTGWWVDKNDPVEFVVSNQAYVGDIDPEQEGEASFLIKTDDANALSQKSIQCNLDISYTEDGRNESVNTVVVQIPVNAAGNEPAEQDDPQKNKPTDVQAEQPFDYTAMRSRPGARFPIYVAGFGVCALGCMVLLLRRRSR